MKISTKGRYALRLMIDIAQHCGEKPVSIKEAAKRQNISDKYLEQIISILNNAGYVKSVRGPQGGYLLKKENIYQLVVYFPQKYNTINYQDIIEGIEISVDSKQVI